MKYMLLNSNNMPTSFYDDSIHSAIPADAIQITEAQWLEFINNQGQRAWDAATNSVISYTPPFNLAAAKDGKKNQIRTAFQTAAELPVTDASGVIWNGGYNSAVKLDAAKRMAQLAGQTTVDFYDVNNTVHTLLLAAADTVILTVGADYQAKFAHKQALMTQVDALPATATQADLDAITVSF